MPKYIDMMRYFLIITLALVGWSAMAQNYKPLEPVEVPDFPTNTIRVDENTHPHGGTYYTASHGLYSRGMTAELGVPPLFDIFVEVKDCDIPSNAGVKLYIGSEEYWKSVQFVSNGKVYIDLLGAHIKHIATSGLQRIVFHKNGDIIHTQEYNPIEQELWRRNAEELCRTIEKFNIL